MSVSFFVILMTYYIYSHGVNVSVIGRPFSKYGAFCMRDFCGFSMLIFDILISKLFLPLLYPTEHFTKVEPCATPSMYKI